jgi:hypothetical protein
VLLFTSANLLTDTQSSELVFRATNDLQLFGQLSYGLMQNLEAVQRYDTNPFFAIIYEAIYCQGYVSKLSEMLLRSNWSIEKHRIGLRREF